LLAGKFIRPNKPAAEKKTIYECGEPTIGSAWIQFDLRFYVVALLFVIFDVEVAFFFPWAEVFGKAQAVASADMPAKGAHVSDAQWNTLRPEVERLIPDQRARERLSKLDNVDELAEPERTTRLVERDLAYTNAVNTSREVMWMALGEIAVFFGVLLVGFAYLWKRGDLEWVRSTLAERPDLTPPPATPNGAGSVRTPAAPALVEAGS
jgi:NADH-quinone oxidoreductase subunit A